MLRRTVLKLGAAGLLGARGIGADRIEAAETIPSRLLWVHRVQTREEGRALYFQDQTLVTEGYHLLCYLLRDVRAEQITRMDLQLIHLLFGMQTWMRACGIRQPLRITSGYRTAETNARIEDAALHSQHVTGHAVDFTVEGIPPPVLAKLALKFAAGGVGAYPRFVHVDTGPVRRWAG